MFKKILMILVALTFLSGCATMNLDKRLSELESRIDQMEVIGSSENTKANFYPASGSITGGGVGALDRITGTTQGDVGIVILNSHGTWNNSFFAYSLDVDGGGTEKEPYIIDSGDGGAEDWELCSVHSGMNLNIWGPLPILNFYDTSCTDTDVNGYISISVTDVDSGEEDADMYFFQQIAGASTNWLHADADGVIDFKREVLVEGNLRGRVESDKRTAATVTVVDNDSGTIFYNDDNDVIEFDLPANPTGRYFCFSNDADSSAAITIDPDDSDYIILDGAAESAGEAIVSSGSVLDHLCVHGIDGSYWKVVVKLGNWDGAVD